MARLLWLVDVLRGAGLTVHEVPGWRIRGADTFGPVVGITCHATAGSRASTDAGEISVLLNGSETAPPPIAQLYLSRTGHWHVVASGTCYHNKVGWGGPNQGHGNDALLGIEAQNDNRGEPWSAHMLDSYQRGVAALCRKLGVSAARVAAHREHQPGNKTDPYGINMATFRARVAALLAGEEDDMAFEAAQEKQLAYTDVREEAFANGSDTIRATELASAGGTHWGVKTLRQLAADVAEIKARPAPGTVEVSDEQLERVLRRVLGSVDGATPATPAE